MSHSPFRLAVLISGGGTTLLNLLETIDRGELDVEISRVISSSAKAAGLEFACQRGIPTDVVRRRDVADAEAFRDAVFDRCRTARVDLVAMAGFLQHLLIPPDFENRVTNIHPALIPAFCGKGFYGLHVHRAVLEYGVKLTGCTVHFVDNQYDHGPIILQRPVAVQADDTPEKLAARVFAEECRAYPEAIRLIAAGKVHIRGRIVHIAE